MLPIKEFKKEEIFNCFIGYFNQIINRQWSQEDRAQINDIFFLIRFKILIYFYKIIMIISIYQYSR